MKANNENMSTIRAEICAEMGAKISQALQDKKLLICVGAGGVGKTSMAATMGVQAAMMGRKVLVLTIDPAKRLANSLGLQEFGNTETQIDLSAIVKKRMETFGNIEKQEQCEGQLWAMMLDGKHAFHDLIDRVAKDDATKKSIYNNNIYQSIADTIVGNQEYMATEKLYDVMNSGLYDLVILDTPPVKNALDFLESPGRMAQFVDKRIMQWFLSENTETTLLKRLISGTSAKLFGLLGHVFGKDFLEDIAIFFQHFKGLYEGFHERHKAVEQLFRDSQTGFIIILAPTEPATEVAHFFTEELKKRHMQLLGIIANQCHVVDEQNEKEEEKVMQLFLDNSMELLPDTSQIFMARIRSAHRKFRMLQEYEENLLSRLHRTQSSKQFFQKIPKIQKELHDITGLYTVGILLLGYDR